MLPPHRFDRITADDLRRRGGLKWDHPFTTDSGAALLPAWVAEMDFGTAPVVQQALHAGADAMAFGYLSAPMVAEMSAACSAYLGARYGWQVDPARIHPVGDVLAALETVLESLCEPGCPLILPTPGYMPFLTVPPSIGRRVVQVPGTADGSGRWSLDLEALDRVLTTEGAGVLVVCNPWNPVGTVLTRDELLEVSELVERHPGVRVFADEIHAPLVYPGAQHVPYASVSAAAAEHSVTATAASKAWNVPGLKTAQLVLTSDADVDRWPAIAFRATHGASNFGVLAAAAAYREGQPWLNEVVDYLDGSRTLLAELLATELPSVGYRPPDGTYLAWLDCRGLDLESSPAEFFRLHAGVVLVDGATCGAVGADFVRLNFATPRPVLVEIVGRMSSAVRSSAR